MPTRLRKSITLQVDNPPATRSGDGRPVRIRKAASKPEPLATPTADNPPKAKGISLTDAQANSVPVPGGPTLKEILADPYLRFTHLYYTKNKHGEKVHFEPWPEQNEMYWGMHFLNIILKARQRGITTAIQIYMLDCCLFNEDINAGVIAHNREDAQKFFDDKIKYAYDNLPAALRAAIPARNDNTNELSFSNGSSIRVGTSMRSGTLQYLHISEYGKICAKWPDKAQEIRSGSLNTVAPGSIEKANIIFIESTAEGAHGDFYAKCDRAEKLQLSGDPLTPLDYKFFFFPWWRAPEYRMTGYVAYTSEDLEYFSELKDQFGIVLDREQMNWYVKKKEEQGDVMMTQEYPSTPEEAFRGIVDGAVFAKQLRAIRKERRIREIPVIQTAPVNTFWDIGRDMTSIWFHQRVGEQNRFVDFHQEPNQNLPYFARLLLQDQNERFHKYNYTGGVHYFPHDMGETDYSTSENKTRREIAQDLGLKPARIVERILNIDDGIEMARQALASSYFDKERCDEGIKALESYRYEWDEKHEIYTRKPLHNWASHGADAYRQFAQGYKVGRYSHRAPEDDHPLSRASRQRARSDNDDWRV